MPQPREFLQTIEKLTIQIGKSKSKEDLSHAKNTMYWIKQLRPDADDLLLIAGFGHDVERSLPDRYRHTDFPKYDDYKRAHATRSGQVVSDMMKQSGYSLNDSVRVAQIISEGEFDSEDPDIQLLCDADSISFFDNNLSYYLKEKGEADTRKKITFMYDRSSEQAQKYIGDILADRPELNLQNVI